MDHLIFEGIQTKVVIGVLPGEKIAAQPVLVDLKLYCDLSEAASTDELAKTIDYAEVVAAVKTVIETGCCDLLETAAANVVDALFKRYVRIEEQEITLYKPGILEGVERVGVSLVRSRK